MIVFVLFRFPWIPLLVGHDILFLNEGQSEQNDRSESLSPSRLAGPIFSFFNLTLRAKRAQGDFLGMMK